MANELDAFITALPEIKNTDTRSAEEIGELLGLKVAEEKLPEWPAAARGDKKAKDAKRSDT